MHREFQELSREYMTTAHNYTSNREHSNNTANDYMSAQDMMSPNIYSTTTVIFR
jgi:hypothetical protein